MSKEVNEEKGSTYIIISQYQRAGPIYNKRKGKKFNSSYQPYMV